MKSWGTLIGLLLAAAVTQSSLHTSAQASPIPQPPELWIMDADGSDQRILFDPQGHPGISGPPSWAPDGSRVLFVTSDSLRTVSPSGGEPTTVATQYGIGYASWSPTGEWIAFSTSSGTPRGAFLVRPDGSELHHVGPDVQVIAPPKWSPDGTRLALVTATDPSSPFLLQVVTISDEATTVLATNANWSPPAWSPDGTRVTYVDAANALVTVALDGVATTVLSTRSYKSHPSWAPDGSKIAFGDEEGLLAVNPDGSGKIKFAEFGGDPQWRADGDVIAFTSSDIHSVQRDGAGLTNLTNTDDRYDSWPRWSPDGTLIAYLSQPEPCCIPPDETITSEVRLRARGHLTFRGRVVESGTSHGACTWYRRRVILQQRKPWGWDRVARAWAEGELGRFEASVRDREGRFRAVVKEIETFGVGGNTITCTAARSPVVRHRH